MCYPGIGGLNFKLSSTVDNGGYGFVNSNGKSAMHCCPGMGGLNFKLSSVVGNGGYCFVNSNDKSAVLGQLDQMLALLQLNNEGSVMVNYK